MNEAIEKPDVDPYVTIARLAATRDGHRLASALAALDEPEERIVETLGRHTLIRQTLMTLGDGDAFLRLPPGLRAALDGWHHRRWPSIGRLMSVYSHAASALQKAGIPALLLKGFHLGGRLYGGLDRRPQFDIDLLVRRKDFKPALRVLEESGFDRHGYDAHSRTLRFDGVKLDLHHGIQRAPAFKADERRWWRTAVSVDCGAVTFRTLSDEWTLVQLLHATYEDVGQGMARLRQLVDLFLLVRELDRTLDWDAFFDARRRESFDRVALNVLALLTVLFGARGDWPGLEAALAARSGAIAPDSVRKARSLVFAPRKHPANLEWFASLYPGSLKAYLAWFWFHGFPGNLSGLTAPRLLAAIRLASRHRAHGPGPSGPSGE